MLCREIRAARMIGMMLSFGIKTANQMSTEEACREYEKIRRGARPGTKGVATHPAELQRKGLQKRRARQGKRGKR